MISRLSIAAALFAFAATSALAMSGNTAATPARADAATGVSSVTPMKTVQLERVVIVGKRIAG